MRGNERKSTTCYCHMLKEIRPGSRSNHPYHAHQNLVTYFTSHKPKVPIKDFPNSSPLYRLWDLEKIRAISSMDMKHVFIAGTSTGVSKSQTYLPKGKSGFYKLIFPTILMCNKNMIRHHVYLNSRLSPLEFSIEISVQVPAIE